MMRSVLSAGALCALSFGATAAEQAAPAEADAALLIYQITEADGAQRSQRLLVTPEFVRIEEGDGSGYLLFDRTARVVYSVAPEMRSLIELSPRPVEVVQPTDLEIHEALEEDGKTAVTGDRPARRLRLWANDELCEEAVVVPDAQADAVAALIEFEQLLGYQEAAAYTATPELFQGPCDLALQLFARAAALHRGLPVEQRRYDGEQRVLIGQHPRFRVPAARFRLPEGYARQSLRALQPN